MSLQLNFQPRNVEAAGSYRLPHTGVERILIVRLSAMGDVIHTLPAVQMLRDAFPFAHIGWLIEERWAELLCAGGYPRRGPRSPQRPLVDEVHVVNLKAWGKELFSLSTVQNIARVWNDIRAAEYDVAVDLQGAIRSALLARWSGAGTVYGAAQPRESPASMWYTRNVITSGRHVVEQNASVARAIIESQRATPTAINSYPKTDPIELPRDPRVELSVERQLGDLNITEFAILNPGAGWGAKRWPAERYGEVARKLSERGLRSIVNYGPGEKELAQAVETASAGTAPAMKSSVTELIALTRRARLFIGGDTGPLHLAAGLRVPVVGIYGPTDPARNGPYGTRSLVLRSEQSVTSHARLAKADEGMLGITSSAVVAAAETLLNGDLRD